MTTTVAMLRRYPVKSMGGEGVGSVAVDARGLAGDRAYAVLDDEGRMATFKNSRRFRRHDEIGSFVAGTDDEGVWVTRADRRWRVDDPALAQAVSAALGTDARVEAESTTPHFDAGAVSLVGTATLDWCREHLGVDADPRRLRPNVVVRTDEPFVEEGWSGTVTIGGCELRPVERIERCRTIDVAQDGVEGTTRWLTALSGRELCVGVYLDVVRPGELRVGDEVLAQ